MANISGLFHLRKPPLVTDRTPTRGAFLTAKFGPILGSSKSVNRSVFKLWRAAGGKFWGVSDAKLSISIGKTKISHQFEAQNPKIFWPAAGVHLRKPPLVPDRTPTRGGFLMRGGFLKWNSPDT